MYVVVCFSKVFTMMLTLQSLMGGTYTNWDVLLVPDKENDNGKV